ncbi:MAG: T9SS type A sorting domain-containing protein [Marinifilaceae bacterium]
MKKTLLLILLGFLFSWQGNAEEIEQTKSPKVKNIVITEKTYKALTNPRLNLNKMAKISDRKRGIRKIKDDPFGRVHFDELMLRDPQTGKIPANIRAKELQFISNHREQLQSRLKSNQLNWLQRGPYNVGGRTRALAIDVADEKTILAGGVSGGMWRSTDEGKTWKKTTGSNEHQSVTAIAQDPREGKTNIWYYSTGELVGSSAGASGARYRGNGIFKSTDNGETWSPLDVTASNTPSIFDRYFDYCWNIIVDPTNGDVYVATFGGIFRSQDEGKSWGEAARERDNMVLASSSTTTNDSYFTDIICTPEGVKYATLSSDGEIHGIFRSESGNKGDWTNITPENFPKKYDRIVLANAPSNSNIVYFLGATPDEGFEEHSFWKLTWDATSGANWENRSNNLPPKDKKDEASGFDSQGSYNMIIKVAPKDENMVFIGGTNLFRSTNGFATNFSTRWIGGYAGNETFANYPNHHPDQHSLSFKNDTTLISGHDGGLSISYHFDANSTEKQPVKWVSLNNGYYTTQVYTVGIEEDYNDSDEIISGFQDNGTWYVGKENTTEKWIDLLGGDGGYCSLHASHNSFIASSQNGTTYLQFYDETDKEWKFTRVDPEGPTEDDVHFINPYIVDSNNDQVMYFAGGKYIWRNSNIYGIPLFSNDKATKNWEKLEQSVSEGKISALETSVTPGNILFYGTSQGKIYKLTNASTENAKQVEITGENMPEGAYVSSIEADPLDADKILISFSNYKVPSIYYTENGGESWTKIGGTLEENTDGSGDGPSIRWVNLIHTPSGLLYLAGTSTGLYSTTELKGNDTQWTQESPEMIGSSIVNMVKTRRDGFIVAGSHGNGIFSAKVNFSAVKPQPDFVASQTTVPTGTPINFKDRSLGVTTKWNWTFEGAQTTSSTQQHPSGIEYNQEGSYTVSLTTTNENGEASVTKTAFITVSNDVVGVENVLENQQESDKFNIYPNPMREKAQVNFSNPNHTQYRLIVLDASGRVVKIIENITNNNVIINRNQLKPGLHIINLQGEKIYKGKLLVK